MRPLLILLIQAIALSLFSQKIFWNEQRLALEQLIQVNGDTKDSTILTNFKIVDSNIKYWNDDTLVKRKGFRVQFSPEYNWNKFNRSDTNNLIYTQTLFDFHEIQRRHLQRAYYVNRAYYHSYKRNTMAKERKTILNMTENGFNMDSLLVLRDTLQYYLEKTRGYDNFELEPRYFNYELGVCGSLSYVAKGLPSAISFELPFSYKYTNIGLFLQPSVGGGISKVNNSEKMDIVMLKIQIGYTICLNRKIQVIPSAGISPTFLFIGNRQTDYTSISPMGGLAIDYSFLKVMNYRKPDIIKVGRFYNHKIRMFFYAQRNNFGSNLDGIGFVFGLGLVSERRNTKEKKE